MPYYTSETFLNLNSDIYNFSAGPLSKVNLMYFISFSVWQNSIQQVIKKVQENDTIRSISQTNAYVTRIYIFSRGPNGHQEVVHGSPVSSSRALPDNMADGLPFISTVAFRAVQSAPSVQGGGTSSMVCSDSIQAGPNFFWFMKALC